VNLREIVPAGDLLARMHPILVHLPLGMLAALVVVELLSLRRASADPTRRIGAWLRWLTALAALLTAGSGWLLATEDAYGGETVLWHRWASVAFAGVLLLVALAPGAGLRRLGLLVAVLLATFTGHLGGTLTHGPEFLRSVAPAWVASTLDLMTPRAATTQAVEAEGDAKIVFDALRRRCWECHGPDKAKKKLRLDRADGLLSVVVPRDAPASELFRRVTLPADDRDRMPAEGPPLDGEVILAIQRWINAGAPTEGLGGNGD